MPGTVRLLVQLQHPGTKARERKFAQAGGSKPAGIISAYGSRKDGMVSVSGQRCKPGDGFPDVRLVMSIILRRIFNRKKRKKKQWKLVINRKAEDDTGRVPGGRKRLPV